MNGLTRQLLVSHLFLIAMVLWPSQLLSQWDRTNGPYGGEVLTFLANDSIVLAGTDGGGLFKSTTGGRNWQLLLTGDDGGWAVTHLFQLDTRILAATRQGILHSTDGGSSWWISADTTLRNFGVNDLTRIGSYVFAATQRGVYRSTDSGITWVHSNHGFTSQYALSVSTIDTTLVAGSEKGLFASTDLGLTWQRYAGLDSNRISDITPVDGVLFVGADSGAARSTNRGATWEWVGTAREVRRVFVDNLGNLYAACLQGYGLLKSTDNGTSWVNIDSTIPSKSFTAIAALQDTLIVAPYPLGVYRSENRGETWQISTDGLAALGMNWVHSTPNTVFTFSSANYTLYRSTTQGLNWEEVTIQNSGKVIYSIANVETTLIASLSHDLLRSTDQGITWHDLDTDFIKGTDRIFHIYSHNNHFFLVTRKGIWRSSDAGLSWQDIDPVHDKSVGSLAYHGDVIAVLGAGETGTGTFVYHSTDLGNSWTTINPTTVPSTESIYGLYLYEDVIVIGSYTGFHRSTDMGNSWLRSDGLFWPKAWKGSHLYGTKGDMVLAHSVDAGATWNNISEGLPHYFIRGVCVSDDYLFAALPGGSVVRRRITASGSIDNELAAEFVVFPSPTFEELITFLTLPISHPTMMKVYNSIGECVLYIPVEPGSSRLHADVSNLPPGVYTASYFQEKRLYVGRFILLEQ